MKKVTMFRQGDVGLQVDATIPKGAAQIEIRPLALGEVTGHAHKITEGDISMYEHEGKTYLRVHSTTAKLTHEEHGPITVPTGDYIVRIQQDYEPEGWTNVKD